LHHARSTLPQRDEGVYNLEETKLTSDGDMEESTHEPLDSDIIGAADKSEEDSDDGGVPLYSSFVIGEMVSCNNTSMNTTY